MASSGKQGLPPPRTPCLRGPFVTASSWQRFVIGKFWQARAATTPDPEGPTGFISQRVLEPIGARSGKQGLPPPRPAMTKSLSKLSPSSSQSARSSTLDVVEKGPVMRDNVLFLKIRRCPCCNLTNACPNPITQGPLSIEQYATVIWAFGSSKSPRRRLDKICLITTPYCGNALSKSDVDL